MTGAGLLTGLVGLALAGALVPAPLGAAEPLQPYQMVRSLQLVQDRIASGDHAALPMQAKLLDMVDARLRTATPETFAEPKNFRALMVYGMSGGNPVTVEAAASRLHLDEQNRAIATGIVAYLSGRPAAAITALEPVDPKQLPVDLGAFIALVKGSLLATDRPADALALLDQARLLSPGTLVEEAALRRSVAIDAVEGDAARFALASTQYVARYLYSPYASQFADAFVSGVIAMHEAISKDKLADITAMMDAEREKVIYLRIARRAAIDGLVELSAFASARAEEGRNGKDNDDDPRALLYSSLSSVTSATVEDVRAKLETIDRSKLSEGDQSLLDAVQAVVREMVSVPGPAAPPPATEAAAPAEPESAVPAASGQPALADSTDLPPVEDIVEETPAVDAAPPAPSTPDLAEAVPPEPVVTEPIVAEPAKDTGAAPDPTDTAIADARQKLESIDQMLGDSPQ